MKGEGILVKVTTFHRRMHNFTSRFKQNPLFSFSSSPSEFWYKPSLSSLSILQRASKYEEARTCSPARAADPKGLHCRPIRTPDPSRHSDPNHQHSQPQQLAAPNGLLWHSHEAKPRYNPIRYPPKSNRLWSDPTSRILHLVSTPSGHYPATGLRCLFSSCHYTL